MPINQERSGKISWRLWRKAQSIWATNSILKQPLGKWYKYGNELDRIWPSYYDFIDGHLGEHILVTIGVICSVSCGNRRWVGIM
eukprot:5977031-Ditylum_brightwellii.AAC.1